MKPNHFGPAEGTSFLTPRGRHLAALLGAIGLVLGASAASGSLLDYPSLTTGEILLSQRSIADSNATPPAFEGVPLDTPQTMSAPRSVDRHKSPGRAALMNLVLPGLGHIYAGNKRGWINLGMEGASWVTYLYYHDRGASKENEYEAHADEHWDYDKWVTDCGCAGSPEDSLIVYFKENNKQHYYEDIVKLSTYSEGWDDPANRSFNRGIRNDSNNFKKNARYAVVGGFVNRIVSAVDVLRILKNRGGASLGNDTHMRLHIRTKPFSSENALGFTVTKRL